MPILYLAEQGSKIKKEGNRIIVIKEGVMLADVSLFKIDTIAVFGNVQFSTQALGDILSKGIDLSFLTVYGRIKGRIESYKSKNVLLRMAQYEAHRDRGKALEFAKVFIRAKVENSIGLLKSYEYRDKSFGLQKDISEMQARLKNLDVKDTVEALMGAEGYMARVYFTGFKKLINRGKIIMQEREQRGSYSFVNQLLSLGYTCLMNEVISLISASGLDPYVGFLHALDYGRPSLALDVLEEYRQPVIDRFTLNLVNKKIITVDDFQAEEEGLRLKQDKLKEYFKLYEEWMRDKNRIYGTEKCGYREILQAQVRRLALHIKENSAYKPFAAEY